VGAAIVLGLGITLGAGGLALADIATSPSGIPSGTVLTCAGKGGALRYVRRGGCRRGERRLVLADSAPLIATLPPQGGSEVSSPGLTVFGLSSPGDFEAQISSRVARDARKCAYIATASVAPQSGHVTRQVEVVAAPLDARHILFHESDSSGAVTSDGISVEIYCP
jgi:hypothetical protein